MYPFVRLPAAWPTATYADLNDYFHHGYKASAIACNLDVDVRWKTSRDISHPPCISCLHKWHSAHCRLTQEDHVTNRWPAAQFKISTPRLVCYCPHKLRPTRLRSKHLWPGRFSTEYVSHGSLSGETGKDWGLHCLRSKPSLSERIYLLCILKSKHMFCFDSNCFGHFAQRRTTVIYRKFLSQQQWYFRPASCENEKRLNWPWPKGFDLTTDLIKMALSKHNPVR